MFHNGFTRYFSDADAAYPRFRIGKVPVNQLFAQSDSLKYLRPAVTSQCGSPHFGQDFKDAFVQGLSVVFLGFFMFHGFRKTVFFNEIMKGGVHSVGVYRSRSVAKEQRTMHNLPRFSCFYNEAHPGSFFCANKMMMDSCTRQQRGNGHP